MLAEMRTRPSGVPPAPTRETGARQARRVHPPHSAPVHVQIMGRESLDLVTARDISATGIGVHVPHGFDACDLASDVELVITLPGARPFLAAGRLRHRTKGFFGVEFTRLSAPQRAEIEAYVALHHGERR